MTGDTRTFRHDSPGAELLARRVAWDETAFGIPVASIDRLRVVNDADARKAFEAFEQWRDEQGVAIVSCRLALSALDESMFLEDRGFRFIETILLPRLEHIDRQFGDDANDEDLVVGHADEADLASLRQIATNAFVSQRYHVDPRIDTHDADQRYLRWIDDARHHPTQQLLKIASREGVVGMFIVERVDGRRVYWHLTALGEDFRGRGMAKRAWQAVLTHHRADGIDAVSTRISASNLAALNLYASLGFRFGPAEMTFHWVADSADDTCGQS